METQTNGIMKASEIRIQNPSGKMTMKSGTNEIHFDNGVVLTSVNSREKTKLWNKLKRMGYEQHYNLSSDEFTGLSVADPKEVFNCTILSK
jgi:hypothetical protein